ncbi:hypothetical protein E2C01_087743 [Portunus trituberculatus]|uniref:Uncharacterized protein n=1 Tax=Portunus trituberculatus TaxID=210409 RepID=A0A5B7J8Z7_PORTR|nr:hypothetical protein [Portunus trituberculatus]
MVDSREKQEWRLEKECGNLETIRRGSDAFKSKIGAIKLKSE